MTASITASITAAGALTLTAASPAFADDVPTAGSLTTLTEHATSVVIACADVAYSFDLDGAGQVKAGESNVANGVIHVPLTTTAQDLIGSSPEFGAISVRETSPAYGELTEQATGPGPENETMPANFSITVDRDPCHPVTRHGGPETLVAAAPASLTSSALTAFPAVNQMFQLQQPVDLYPAGSPDTVVAQLLQFPVDVSHD